MVSFPYSEELVKMAHEILMKAAEPYTDSQLKEIPRILNAKHRYFIANDLRDWEALRDVFTEEAPEGFRAFWTTGGGKKKIDEQLDSVRWSIGEQENIVPTHYGVNQIVYFIDDTHAQLLTRMHDHHVYMDNGELYAGWGLYVDDVLKCKDGKWRISTIRLNYGQMENQLRPVLRMMEASAANKAEE